MTQIINRIFSFLTLVIVFSSFNLQAKDLKFKMYGIDDGICHPFIYTINQDRNGFIWVGTGEGLCRFDGFNFRGYELNDSITESNITVSYKDDRGNLWLANNFGGIYFYNGVSLESFYTEEIISSTVNDISADSNGNVYCVTQNDGIVRITKGFSIDTFQTIFKNHLLYSIGLTDENEILIGTGTGLELLVFNEEDTVLKKIDEIPFTKVQCITKRDNANSFWVGTEDGGFYLVEKNSQNGFNVTDIGAKYNMGYENVQSIEEDDDEGLWISTFGNGLFNLIKTVDGAYDVIHYVKEHGLETMFIKSTFQDDEGNIWVATYGKGLAYLIKTTFTFSFVGNEIIGEDVSAVFSDNNYYWVGGRNGLAMVDKKDESSISYFTKNNGLPSDLITALFKDSKDNLWIGTATKGLYRLRKNNKRVERYHYVRNSISNSINAIAEAKGNIWIATKNGVFSFDIETGEKVNYNTNTGLPHNNINHVFTDSEDQIWISTKSNGIFTINDDIKYDIPGIVELEFTAVTEDDEGNIWASTYGDGVFKFTQDTFYQVTTEEGLKSNFCYSILTDKNASIWVGHRLGISRINVNNLLVKTYSKEIGIKGDCNYNASAVSRDGNLYWGTTNGLVKCDLSDEKKNLLPPRVNVTSLKISDEVIDLNTQIVKPYGVYKLELRFIGLNYSAPDKVSYQYKLEGYDLEWSNKSSSTGAFYGRIEDGEYTFLLKACNSDGICSESPLELKITIKKPIWKTAWFITLFVIVVILAIYIIIKIRERKQKQLQEYLEKELAQRTKEVVKQKEELEVKNRDITDSINYAQRIQSSILPANSRLEANFTGSFVFYKPRDIVSGDFYWHDKVTDNKFIIVCSDSTGHGVPGAFMSMIGTTLIKDISKRPGVDSPSDILSMLDSELGSILNQDKGYEKSNDGMDIIVCEINTDNYYVRLASAMRPIIIYQNKELIYVKGSRSSIGGKYDDEKDFEVKGFQLGKGDIIYMFSDGYTDQFGGPLGKKYKMIRLKNLLTEICHLPMNEQQKAVENAFDEWMGKYKQVDDVLFMGIQI